jgi:hypothetical protein
VFKFEFSKEFIKKENIFLSFLRPWPETLFCFVHGLLVHRGLGGPPGANPSRKSNPTH